MTDSREVVVIKKQQVLRNEEPTDSWGVDLHLPVSELPVGFLKNSVSCPPDFANQIWF